MSPNQAVYSYIRFWLHLAVQTIATEKLQLALIDLLHFPIISNSHQNRVGHFQQHKNYSLHVHSDSNIYENEQSVDIFTKDNTIAMDDIQVASSENSSQSCVELNYNADQLFQIDEPNLLNFGKNPNPFEEKSQAEAEDIPTYNQIVSITNAIIEKYPYLSITTIARHLYEQLIPIEKKYKFDCDPTKQERKKQVEQCKYIAKAYVELGYGVSKLRKQIAVEGINITINNAQTYERLINRVFFCAYRKLEDFLRTECRGQRYLVKLRPLKTQFDKWALCQTLKNPGNCLSSQSCHTLDKLLKLTYVDYAIKMTKTQACNLYYALHHFIEQRRKKGEMKVMQQVIKDDNASISSIELDDEFYLEDKDWSDEMEKALCLEYCKCANNPNHLQIIQKQFKIQFPKNSSLFNQSYIEGKLDETLQKIIYLIQEQLDQKVVLELGNRFRRLVILNDEKVRQILVDEEAWSLRACLCEYYFSHCQSIDKAINIDYLACAVLSINEFLNKKQNKHISRELEITKFNNRIDREEYKFGGKRRKVLIFKKNGKRYNASVVS